MTLDWKSFAARVDDMSLRERAMLFASASLVILVFAHVALIDPVLRKHKSLIDRVSRDQTQVNAVRAQIEQIVKSDGSQARHPDEEAIAALERKIAEAEGEIEARQSSLIAPERLPALLKEILGRSQTLRLESLRLLPGVPVGVSRGAKTAPGLYRHGVEVTLKGSYFDLLRYLEELEKRSSVLLWGKVELLSEHYPEVRLHVVIHTLSPSPSLLVI